ncbi:histidine kinase N-terminal 7TM domain-containing protein [Halomicroarcula sp. GCM10025709]|uniref:histidine kinase N-terminal 7TM domain-containing protein n=1 Tax=Haloarcula TaxID=2237 RepID=UPI0024C2724E|nr:histidine kinase N-terminal 7TM domain-containing protein [Halomicroarcula sp. YJ-61-S]
MIVLASIGSGVASLGLVWYLSRRLGRPGAKWFMLSLAAQALWTLSYGAGLVVSDPSLRAHAEALAWIGMNCIGPFFLAFALEYTGRSTVTGDRWLPVLLVSPIVTATLAVTHGYHDLLWQAFRMDPVFGLSTAQYAIQPLGYATVIASLTLAGIGVLLIVETVYSYGPLYRREAVAVALSPVPATVPLLVWLGQIGPWPALNLTPALLLTHVALDAYAFTGTHMFETNPVTQRAAEETIVDGLQDPLLVLDTSAQVVRLNDSARELFGTAEDDLPVPIESLTGVTLSGLREDGQLEAADGTVYAVSSTPLTDSRAADVGCVVVLHDITVERKQRQQLSVLNRVLRHNLRNEMTVVRGHGESIKHQTDKQQFEAQAGSILDASDRLLSIAGKIRSFEQLRDAERQRTDVDVADLLSEISAELLETYPDAEITVDGPAAAHVRTEAAVLRHALRNLSENAIRHGETQRVELTFRREDGVIVFEVRDENERIPEIETEPIETGTVEALSHGRGIGLWIANWAVNVLDGTLLFGYDGGNVVTVEIPAA